jgi:hypothetical protein
MTRVWSWYIGQNTEIEPDAREAAPVKVPEEWWERIVKGVPAEAAGAYTAALPIAKTGFSDQLEWAVLAIVLAAGVVFTLVAMLVLRGLDPFNRDRTKARAARTQVFVAVVAFLVWAYAQGGIFDVWTVQLTGYSGPVYHDGVAGLLAIATGFLLLVSNKIAGVD